MLGVRPKYPSDVLPCNQHYTLSDTWSGSLFLALSPSLCDTRWFLLAGDGFVQGVVGIKDSVVRGDCSTLPGNELPRIAEQVTDSQYFRILLCGCLHFSSGLRLFIFTQ